MYYFIHILYTISTVSSFSLEVDESVVLGFGLHSDINDTSDSRSLEHNTDSEKAALIPRRKHHKHPATLRAKDRDPSLWYSVQSFGPAGKLSIANEESFSSDSDDGSNSDANFEEPIVKPKKPIERIPKRTHKATYKSTRLHSSTKGRNRKKKHTSRQDLNKKLTTAKTIKKKKKLDAVDQSYIVQQILYNGTHSSSYSEPLHGTYDINGLWSKQQIVPPPSSRPRDKISLIGNKGHKNKVKDKNTSLKTEKNKPRSYANKDNQFDIKDIVNGFNRGVNDLFHFISNKLDLPKLNDVPGPGRMTDVSFILPTDWIENVKNISAVILDWTFKKPAELFQAAGNKIHEGVSSLTNATAEGIDNLWQNDLKPSIDQVKDAMPGIQKETENIAQTVVNGTNSLWQPWIHRVGDDHEVNSFMKHILRRNQKIFDIIENKSKDKRWKAYVRYLAKTYDERFNEFIQDTSQHKIKSRMGSERVILNSIDVSNRILRRLVNFAMDDMDNDGLLKENSDIPKMIGEKIDEETDTFLERACTQLDVCRLRNGFIDFVGDVFTTVSSLDSNKFQLATSALSAAVKKTDLTPALGPQINKRFVDRLTKFDALPYIFKIGSFNIMKNIITNRNSPLVVYGDSKASIADKTVAMLDVINMLDQKVPGSVDNVKKWNNIRTELNNFAQNRNQNIMNTMSNFVDVIKKTVGGMDAGIRNKIQNSAKLFLSN